MVHVFFSSLLFSWSIFVISCNHFNGGTITWRPLNASATGTPVAIIITQTYSWSYSLMTCTSSMIAANQLVPNYSALSTRKLQCINNCVNGSIGYSNVTVIPYCISISPALGVTIGQRSDIVYLASGDDFSIAYQDANWRSLASSSAATWSLSTRISVQPRSDNGLYNNAPVSTIMSPIYVPLNETKVINIPVSDADGDVLRCRWATSSNGVDECGGICPPGSLPSGTVLYPNCTLVITGQILGSWYAIPIMVEDFINSSSTIPLSSVPVQFLVYVPAPTSCSQLPVVFGIPPNSTCQAVIVGQTVRLQLMAINYCGSNVSIVDILLVAFPNVTQNNISQLNPTTYNKNITWIPSSEQLGYQIMCAMALDSQNSQSSSVCFTFYVSTNSLCSCPNEPCSTTTTTSTTRSTSTSTTSTSVSATSTTSSTRTTSTSTTSTSVSATSTTSSTRTTSTSTTSTSISTISTTSMTQSITTSTTSRTSTTSSVTTITSTTSTSAYVYTPNTTTTSAISVTNDGSSSEPGEVNLYKWLIYGSIAGVPLLLALILGGCLCWYYCSPCGIGRLKLSDCQGPFEFYHIDLDTTSNVSNRYTIHKNEREQHSDDEYSVNTIEVQSSPQPYRDNIVTVYRTRRFQPKRVAVMTHSSIPSQYPINQTPDYERKMNNVHVRHIRWPQRWIKNEYRPSQFDNID